MNKEELIEKLKAIVKPYTNNQEAYDNMNEDTDFINDLKINSANLVDIILDIEEAFDITIDNTEMERMLNVKAAIEIVEAKI
jgi:acyl carrier protein